MMQNNKIKTALIFGTRPEAVKMAPVVMEMQKRPDLLEPMIIVTAQHREMLDQVLELFNITPHEDLDIMEPNQTLTRITVKAMEGLEKLFEKNRPHMVLTQGDTTTAFAASLSAFYGKIPVGHVEAGLRTDNIYDPFPEEMNRRLITGIASLNFAPTPLSVANLRRFGADEKSIHITGNTVIDALLYIAEKCESLTPVEVTGRILPNKRILLVEAHRRENLGSPMENICRALLRLVNDFEDTQLIFPVHKNPKVRETVFPLLGSHPRITLLEPVDYPVLVSLIKRSHLILTDSGGIQEEAPSLGKPVLVMRRTTERPEGVDAGTAALVGVDENDIYRQGSALLTDTELYNRMARAVNPYGDGQAARRTVEAILHYFGKREAPPKPYTAESCIASS